MTLLITVFAAIISTIVWYQKAPQDHLKLATLCFLYWGATLMWMVDAVFAFIELKDAYFQPNTMALLNDTFLGFSVVALGLVIWLVLLFVKDPQGKIKQLIVRKEETHV